MVKFIGTDQDLISVRDSFTVVEAMTNPDLLEDMLDGLGVQEVVINYFMPKYKEAIKSIMPTFPGIEGR